MNKTKLIVKTILDRSNKNALSFLNESTNQDSYDKWHKRYRELTDNVARLSTEMYENDKKYRLPSGAIPYEVRISEEYKEEHKEYDKADNELKFYYKNSPKEYIKQSRKDSQAKRKQFMKDRTEEHRKN